MLEFLSVNHRALRVLIILPNISHNDVVAQGGLNLRHHDPQGIINEIKRDPDREYALAWLMLKGLLKK